jgi:hypothetical protein
METTLVKIDDFKSLISTAPAVLEENKTSSAAALEKGKELIALAAQRMDDTIDGQLSGYIVRSKATVKDMKERREPFTQIMTAVAKEFTTLEASLKTPIDECQRLRDAYATKKMEERREQERLATLKLQKQQELIEAEKQWRLEYANHCSDYSLRVKNSANAFFNALTLNSLDGLEALRETAQKEISSTGSDFSEAFNFSVSQYPYHYASHEEFTAHFPMQEKNRIADEARARFQTEISIFRQELLDMLPSKLNQLKENLQARLVAEAEAKRKADEAEAARIAEELARKAAEEAKGEERARLEAEVARKAAEAAEARLAAEAEEARRKEAEAARLAEENARQAEEAARLAEEAEAARRKAEEEAALRAAESRASAYVDTQAELFEEAPKVKEGYRILLKDSSAYLLLTQLWYENEGKTLPAEKFESVTFGRIKTWCEKHAAKNEAFIASKFIEYKPVYKAK